MMFATNPFASSIHVFPPPNSFLDHENDDVYTHPFVSGDCCFHSGSPPPVTEKFTASKQDSVEGLGWENSCDEYNHLFVSEKVSPTDKKKPSKKDHHSKIHTAQGPRDRRVRLSIEVARKFFYLQDILGFDKASKTLDWLFTKSKIPIDELVKGKEQSEIVFKETVKEVSNEHVKGQKKKSATKCVEGKRKKITGKYKSGFPLNQSRVEARARARERTKEKLHIKKLDNESKKVLGDHCHCCCSGSSTSNLTIQSSFWSSIESKNVYNDRIAESVTEEKISMLYTCEHNVCASTDSSSKFTSLPRFMGVHEQQGDRVTI